MVYHNPSGFGSSSAAGFLPNIAINFCPYAFSEIFYLSVEAFSPTTTAAAPPWTLACPAKIDKFDPITDPALAKPDLTPSILSFQSLGGFATSN